MATDKKLTLRSGDMDLRDYFAAQALAGYVMHVGIFGASEEHEQAAQAAYLLADAMLFERAKAGGA
jgi:hypothetical protein